MKESKVKAELPPRAGSVPGPLPLLALVKKQEFFKGFTTSQYELLAALAVVKEFKKNDILFQEGDPANRFYLILDGAVQLRFESKEGLSIPTEILGPGADLGWTWLFPPYYFSSTAVAIKPTRTLSFFGAKLREQCEANHELGYELMKRIAQVAIRHLSVHRQAAASQGVSKRK